MWAAPIDHERRNSFVFTPHRGERLGLIEAKLWIRPRPHDDWAINGTSCVRPPLLESSATVVFHLSIALYYVCVCVSHPFQSQPSNQLIVRLTCLLACSHTCCSPAHQAASLSLLPQYQRLITPTWSVPPGRRRQVSGQC